MPVTNPSAKVPLLTTLLLVLVLAGCASGLQIPSAGSLIGDGPPDMLNAKLKVPSGSGPFPAVVLMHGCSGWHGSNINDWADWYVERGWVALALDSFGTRGISQICAGEHLGYVQRGLDAYGAFDYLAAQPNVDVQRIIVMGFSNGGSTVIYTMGDQILRAYRQPGQKRFHAGVAFYPGRCNLSKPYGPVTIVTGELDDWTPVVRCNMDLAYNGFPNEQVSFHEIPGAYHAFDMFRWKHKPVKARQYLGHHIEPNRLATDQSRDIVAEFLQHHLATTED